MCNVYFLGREILDGNPALFFLKFQLNLLIQKDCLHIDMTIYIEISQFFDQILRFLIIKIPLKYFPMSYTPIDIFLVIPIFSAIGHSFFLGFTCTFKN